VCSFLKTGVVNNRQQMRHIVSLYSGLQIIDGLYNNYYTSVFMPTILQFGIIILCIPSAVLIAKWEEISNDPTIVLIIIAIINGWKISFAASTVGSKLFTNSKSLLKNMLRVKPPRILHKYLIKRFPLRDKWQ